MGKTININPYYKMKKYKMEKLPIIISLLLAPLAALHAAEPLTANINGPLKSTENTQVLNWGDQGDGTYKNPVLKADYSDPDILRHGDDFYLIASDFSFVGMQILHSKDLVNWSVIGQIFDKLVMSPKYDQMEGYGAGTWAPSLRYNNGEFYVYVCTPCDGLFMWHAKNPAGPWSETVTVLKRGGLEDPCPFWDEDGQAYLVHSRVGAGPLILHKMSPDGTKLLDDGKQIYRGPVAEGPKMYKRKGWYYISLPEGSVETGWQTVLRSKDIYGPYERKEVFPKNSPHQGGIVELDSGESWFLAFKSTGHLGRICYLNPVTWGDDGWPVFGDNGNPVDVWKKPNIGKVYPVSHPKSSDEFTDTKLSPIWQWNHNPVPEAWSLTERTGWLRLKAQPAEFLDKARNTLTQKLWDDTGIIEVKMDVALMKDGQRTGFAFMSGNFFGFIGVDQTSGIRRVVWHNGDGLPSVENNLWPILCPDCRAKLFGGGPALTGNDIWLRGTYNGSSARLSYSLDGQTFVDTGTKVRLRFGFWKGARVSIFSYGGGGGSADFDYVHYQYGNGVKK
jgi:beta-xylosidase